MHTHQGAGGGQLIAQNIRKFDMPWLTRMACMVRTKNTTEIHEVDHPFAAVVTHLFRALFPLELTCAQMQHADWNPETFISGILIKCEIP